MIRKLFARLIDLTLYAIMLWLLYLLIWAPGGLRLYRQLVLLEDTQAKQLQKLNHENKQLVMKHQWLEADEGYLDYEARSFWGVIQPGEDVISIAKQEVDNAMDKYE